MSQRLLRGSWPGRRRRVVTVHSYGKAGLHPGPGVKKRPFPLALLPGSRGPDTPKAEGNIETESKDT